MTAETITDLAELVENFSFFDNWEDRYRYLIELGERLSPMDASLKTDDNLVRGCTSRVWLVTEKQDKQFHFIADSDAQIVRGLVYVVLLAYQDKAAEEIEKIDIDTAFEKLGLGNHLSPNRRSGFFAMVERIKNLIQ